MRFDVLVELLRNRGSVLRPSGRGIFSSGESSSDDSSRPSTVSDSQAADGARLEEDAADYAVLRQENARLRSEVESLRALISAKGRCLCVRGQGGRSWFPRHAARM